MNDFPDPENNKSNADFMNRVSSLRRASIQNHSGLNLQSASGGLRSWGKGGRPHCAQTAVLRFNYLSMIPPERPSFYAEL